MASLSLGDGKYASFLHRPASRRLSPLLGHLMSANSVTFLAFMSGCVAAVCAALNQPIAAGLLLQMFAVLDCCDGEVARARSEANRAGSWLDTVNDKVVESLVLIGVFSGMLRVQAPNENLDAGYPIGLLAVVFYITSILILSFCAEKFQNVYKTPYPKHRGELLFPWVTSGGEARMVTLSVMLILSEVAGSQSLVWMLVALAISAWLNVIWRIGRILQWSQEAE